jgi:hypothetical protein
MKTKKESITPTVRNKYPAQFTDYILIETS